jgi:hypothetical protein|tara:strand:- start:463 stop:597 length:135 start_codon:yes stop_codon:yes gene_type:complete
MKYEPCSVCEDETLSEWEVECFTPLDGKIEQFDWKEIEDSEPPD